MIREADEIKVLFGVPSQKEEAMYEAVIEMLNEKTQITQIKVSDITKRAGIGKGTAYEYFSSKEELVFKAFLYDSYRSIKTVEMHLKGVGTFRDKFYWILEFVEKNLMRTKMLSELMRSDSHTNMLHEQDEKQNSADKCHLIRNYVDRIADLYMETGVKEGLFRESNAILLRSALYTQIMGYMVFIMTNYHEGSISVEEARDFTYRSLIKSLS